MPIASLDDIRSRVGEEVGVSSWIEVDQQRIDTFADATEDHQFIHVDPQAAVVQGYCAAVRSAVTDDGQAPLAASGLKLKQRLEKVADSLARVAEKGAPRRRLRSCNS